MNSWENDYAYERLTESSSNYTGRDRDNKRHQAKPSWYLPQQHKDGIK